MFSWSSKGTALNLITLQLPTEVRQRRKAWNFDRWAYLEPQFTDEVSGHGLAVDTGRLGAEAAVDYILDNRLDTAVASCETLE